MLLSVDEARAEVPVGRTKFFELMASGQIKTVRIGRRRLVPRAALESYVESLRASDELPAMEML